MASTQKAAVIIGQTVRQNQTQKIVCSLNKKTKFLLSSLIIFGNCIKNKNGITRRFLFISAPQRDSMPMRHCANLNIFLTGNANLAKPASHCTFYFHPFLYILRICVAYRFGQTFYQCPSCILQRLSDFLHRFYQVLSKITAGTRWRYKLMQRL